MTCIVVNWTYPFKALQLLYVPPGLTFENSIYCWHCFMSCVWISEQESTIALYSVRDYETTRLLVLNGHVSSVKGYYLSTNAV
jgi:hypothetical protein